MKHTDNNKALAAKFWKAANEGDLEILASLVADDCYFIHSDVRGKEQVVQHFNLDPKPDWGQRIGRMIAENNIVVVESIWHGKAAGPYFDYLLEGKSTGKQFELPMVFIMEFEEGLLKTFNEFFNELDLKRSLTE